MYIKITDVNKTIKESTNIKGYQSGIHRWKSIWIKRKEWFGKDYAYACNMRAYYSDSGIIDINGKILGKRYLISGKYRRVN